MQCDFLYLSSHVCLETPSLLSRCAACDLFFQVSCTAVHCLGTQPIVSESELIVWACSVSYCICCLMFCLGPLSLLARWAACGTFLFFPRISCTAARCLSTSSCVNIFLWGVFWCPFSVFGIAFGSFSVVFGDFLSIVTLCDRK